LVAQLAPARRSLRKASTSLRLGAEVCAPGRVTEMAASGQTNREIAQALFVTEKTVETHLGRAFMKLGVRSRRQLAQALDRETAEVV